MLLIFRDEANRQEEETARETKPPQLARVDVHQVDEDVTCNAAESKSMDEANEQKDVDVENGKSVSPSVCVRECGEK